MARSDTPGLDTPRSSRRRLPQMGMPPDTFGRIAEGIARFMGTPMFLVWMTVICAIWLGWNTMAPVELQFDPRSLNFTLLTLILSLQASYAAPLLLLADNRSADRDRVEFEADRQRAERNLADTEFLAREVASLRVAMREVATRDFIRSELRSLLEEMEQSREEAAREEPARFAEQARPAGESGAPAAEAPPAIPLLAPAQPRTSAHTSDPTPPSTRPSTPRPDGPGAHT